MNVFLLFFVTYEKNPPKGVKKCLFYNLTTTN